VDEYGIERYDKVNLWIGTNFEPESVYQKYFELDYSSELDEPSYKVCGFCKDIGQRRYELDILLQESAIDPSQLENVKAECSNLGVHKANAMFWYSDGGIAVPTPYKQSYNGLKYIGLYEGN
jgi:hypothetical protein